MINHTISIRNILTIAAYSIINFILFISSAFADFSHHKDTIEILDDSLPNDLSEYSIPKLLSIRESYELKIKKIQPNLNEKYNSEKVLLENLITYDSLRLKIADIILTLIEDYNLTGKFKTKLLGYRDTFNTTLLQAHNNINTLDEYKVYSSHFSFTYISFLYTLREEPEFFDSFIRDINNPDTGIGKYKYNLDISYKNVLSAQKDYEADIETSRLKQFLTHIDDNISRRQTKFIISNRRIFHK